MFACSYWCTLKPVLHELWQDVLFIQDQNSYHEDKNLGNVPIHQYYPLLKIHSNQKLIKTSQWVYSASTVKMLCAFIFRDTMPTLSPSIM